jgi:8-oxo-dGTP pyrophosphatase MutT (NUDIX family)
MNDKERNTLFDHPRSLTKHINRVLGTPSPAEYLEIPGKDMGEKGSAVILLVSESEAGRERRSEPCLILNKRSSLVRQPGDLCCPGGGIRPGLDSLLAGLLRIPFSPLWRWPCWNRLKHRHRKQIRPLSILLAVGLREAWEEMRLNPFTIRFLGPLPVQSLVINDRHMIHPLVARVPPGQTFKPNWEVARIVSIPLRHLIDPGRYARFQPMIRSTGSHQEKALHPDFFPCFIHRDEHGRELLWGATFRIVKDFLNLVFDFNVPDLERLPVVHGILDPTYPIGSQNAH